MCHFICKHKAKQSKEQRKSNKIKMALNKAKEIVSSCPVVVFSKTYCGYCGRVKQLLTQLGASYKVIELDEEREGEEIQSALAAWTGQRTVPNVFIGGKHIGGCDTGRIFVDQSLLKPMEVCTQFVLILSVLVVAALTEKHQQGQLVPLLADAGVIANNSAQL